jgi:hypothetical protein
MGSTLRGAARPARRTGRLGLVLQPCLLLAPANAAEAKTDRQVEGSAAGRGGGGGFIGCIVISGDRSSG